MSRAVRRTGHAVERDQRVDHGRWCAGCKCHSRGGLRRGDREEHDRDDAPARVAIRRPRTERKRDRAGQQPRQPNKTDGRRTGVAKGPHRQANHGDPVDEEVRCPTQL